MLATAQAVYPQEVVVSYYENKQSPLIIGVDSIHFDKASQRTLREIKPTGVILMKYNAGEYTQTKSLISQIKEYGKQLGISIKIFVDEEGGLVSRFKYLEGYPQNEGVTNFDLEKTKAHAEYLKEIGVDVNLAPVADIAYTKDSFLFSRSAGNKPEEVASVVKDYVNAMHNSSIELTLKHFPGHGRTEIDSHYDIPTVDISQSDWKESDAIPFIEGIDAKSRYVMFGHLVFPQIDSALTTYSQKWVDILRKDLSFTGEIMTDDLKMGSALSNVEQVCGVTDESEEGEYARRVYLSRNSGINYPLIILTQEQTRSVYRKWLEIEKACLETGQE